MKKSSEQTRLGERHIEVLSNNSTDKQHIDLVVRVVYKIKSRDNGFERFFATINNKRTEVFENINGKTGASFTVIKPIDLLGEIPKESEIHPTPLPYKKENCPNCADQASIAAPGQTVLCKTHAGDDDGEIDELIEEIPTDVHYEPNEPNLSENNEVQDLTSIEFFVANVKSYHASVFGVYCSNCFESESTIAVTTNNYTMFEFCKPCYDKLKRAMIARDARS